MDSMLILLSSFALAASNVEDGCSHWVAEIALEVDTKLGGCAIGDLDPTRDGNEIAVLGSDGKVWLVYREGRAWANEVIFESPGEMIQCAIGDADPVRPGDELVAVGMAKGGEDDGGKGAAFLIARGERGFEGKKIFEDDALLHAVAVAKGAIFVGGYSQRAHRLSPSSKGFRAQAIADLKGAAKSAVTLEEGVAFACTDGAIVVVSERGGIWTSRVVDERPSGRARLGAQGPSLVVSDDDGILSIVGPKGRAEIYREASKLRGAVLGDLDPACPGPEAATAGYLGAITLLYPRDGTWEARPLFIDSDKLHHLTAGDLDGLPGPELASCGYAGKLIVLGRWETRQASGDR